MQMAASNSHIDVSIVTGASTGLGLALAQNLLQRHGQHVLCISRRRNSALEALAANGVQLEQWTHDLSDSAGLCGSLAAWLASFQQRIVRSVTLINNAALMAPAGPLGEADVCDLAMALRVSLEAPMLLTSVFLKATSTWPSVRKVLLVSSGLGRSPMGGQVSYCAAKAGLDHMARACALEEASRPNGARIVSLAPGIVDTDMQLSLRSSDSTRFPNAQLFAKFKADGVLDSADSAASKVLAWLDHEDFGREAVADVRSAK